MVYLLGNLCLGIAGPLKCWMLTNGFCSLFPFKMPSICPLFLKIMPSILPSISQFLPSMDNWTVWDSEIMACLQDAEGKFLKNRRNVLAEMMSRGGYSRTEVRFWKNVLSNSAMLEKLE